MGTDEDQNILMANAPKQDPNATGSNIKGMQHPDGCHLSGSTATETREHLLWDCVFARNTHFNRRLKNSTDMVEGVDQGTKRVVAKGKNRMECSLVSRSLGTVERAKQETLLWQKRTSETVNR